VESRTMNSFWAALSRAEDLQSVGGGLYKLRTWPPSQEEDSTDTPQKEKNRLEQLKDFLRQHGPMQRKTILERSGIPEGTLGMYLKDGPDSPFAKSVSGRWYLRGENIDPGEELESSPDG